MSQDRRYYCSSPALDWRLSGRDTVIGEIQPDPLIYSTEASINTLFENTNPFTGLGKLPPLSSIPQEILETPRKIAKVAASGTKTSQKSFARNLQGQENRRSSQGSKMTQDAHLTTGSSEKVPSTPPSKAARKSKSSLLASPEKTSSPSSSSAKVMSKWSYDEEQCILRSLIASGEKGVDWQSVLVDINALRSVDQPRTMNSVKLHWSKQMKPLLLKKKA